MSRRASPDSKLKIRPLPATCELQRVTTGRPKPPARETDDDQLRVLIADLNVARYVLLKQQKEKAS
jgi:hypothetical protein